MYYTQAPNDQAAFHRYIKERLQFIGRGCCDDGSEPANTLQQPKAARVSRVCHPNGVPHLRVSDQLQSLIRFLTLGKKLNEVVFQNSQNPLIKTMNCQPRSSVPNAADYSINKLLLDEIKQAVHNFQDSPQSAPLKLSIEDLSYLIVKSGFDFSRASDSQLLEMAHFNNLCQRYVEGVEKYIAHLMTEQGFKTKHEVVCKECWMVFPTGKHLGGHMSKMHPGKSTDYQDKEIIKLARRSEECRRRYFSYFNCHEMESQNEESEQNEVKQELGSRMPAKKGKKIAKNRPKNSQQKHQAVPILNQPFEMDSSLEISVYKTLANNL